MRINKSLLWLNLWRHCQAPAEDSQRSDGAARFRLGFGAVSGLLFGFFDPD
jgi:hypothetical protein